MSNVDNRSIEKVQYQQVTFPDDDDVVSQALDQTMQYLAREQHVERKRLEVKSAQMDIFEKMDSAGFPDDDHLFAEISDASMVPAKDSKRQLLAKFLKDDQDLELQRLNLKNRALQLLRR